jgi:hypothetical protein
MGVERGLVKSEMPWFGYRELRNITSHVYDCGRRCEDAGILPV